MDMTIFYFSGTGNSRYVADEIRNAVRDAEVIPIAAALQRPFDYQSTAVGIVTPVYGFALPGMVRRFLKALPSDPDVYYFAVTVCSKFGGGAVGEIKTILGEKGITLAYASGVKMVVNNLLGLNVPPPDKQQGLLLKADEKIKEICGDIAGRAHNKVRSGFPVMSPKVAETAGAERKKTALSYQVSESCTGCGRCVRLCPAGNITLRDGHPAFGRNCEGCLACISWCPRHAIDAGDRTRGKLRYHNPRVSAEELFVRTASPDAETVRI